VFECHVLPSVCVACVYVHFIPLLFDRAFDAGRHTNKPNSSQKPISQICNVALCRGHPGAMNSPLYHFTVLACFIYQLLHLCFIDQTVQLLLPTPLRFLPRYHDNVRCWFVCVRRPDALRQRPPLVCVCKEAGCFTKCRKADDNDS
jgi:hypothetical protein